MAPRRKEMRGKIVSLTGEERVVLWSLCYNVLSNASPWPKGLDVPVNIQANLKEIERVMDKLNPNSA